MDSALRLLEMLVERGPTVANKGFVATEERQNA